MNTMLDGIFMTMSTSTGLYPKLDLWTANKLQLQLQVSTLKSTEADRLTTAPTNLTYYIVLVMHCNWQ